MSAAAEILAVGNELLTGDVLDTNSHWLCGQLTGLGAVVRRVCQLPDEVGAIKREIRDARARGVGLLFTTGGLGPTDDDLTLEGVAGALSLELRIHSLAFKWVRARYEELARLGYVASAEMTPSRTKMARLPVGATPLANGVGAAPGVVLAVGDSTLVSLPGVPAELKDIFQGALRPVLAGLLGKGFFLEWVARVDCGDESVLAPMLGRVAKAHPRVYLKSRAGRFGSEVKFKLTLSARGRDRDQVEPMVVAAWGALRQALAEVGIEVLSVEEVG